MSTFFDDVKDFCTAFGEWMVDHVVDIAFAISMGMVVIVGIWGIVLATTQHREQVDLCVRAFAYSRDQCEFIVSNHIMVNR